MYYKEANPFLEKLSQHVNKLIPEHSHLGAYVSSVKEVYVKPEDDNNQIGTDKGIREINIRKSSDVKQSSNDSSQGVGFTVVEGNIESPSTWQAEANKSVRRDSNSADQSKTNIKYEAVADEFINAAENLKTAADGTQFSGVTKVDVVTTNKYGQTVTHEVPIASTFNPSLKSKMLTILPRGGNIRMSYSGMQHTSKGGSDLKVKPPCTSTDNIKKQEKLSAPVASTNPGFSMKDGVPLYMGVDYANP